LRGGTPIIKLDSLLDDKIVRREDKLSVISITDPTIVEKLESGLIWPKSTNINPVNPVNNISKYATLAYSKLPTNDRKYYTDTPGELKRFSDESS